MGEGYGELLSCRCILFISWAGFGVIVLMWRLDSALVGAGPVIHNKVTIVSLVWGVVDPDFLVHKVPKMARLLVQGEGVIGLIGVDRRTFGI